MELAKAGESSTTEAKSLASGQHVVQNPVDPDSRYVRECNPLSRSHCSECCTLIHVVGSPQASDGHGWGLGMRWLFGFGGSNCAVRLPITARPSTGRMQLCNQRTRHDSSSFVTVRSVRQITQTQQEWRRTDLLIFITQ